MKSVFLGDSLTEGENNNYTSFVDYMPGSSHNLGISGTTIGEYSIYPVDGNSLLSVIGRHSNTIHNADDIFIEYGLNDVAAVMCGFATVKTVTISFVKALDWIRQLNPNANIYFLAIGDPNVINIFCRNESHYLESDYFKDYDFKFPYSIYEKTYYEILNNIRKKCDIIHMFTDNEFNAKEYLSDDNIHPNNEGHKLIASNICKHLGYV